MGSQGVMRSRGWLTVLLAFLVSGALAPVARAAWPEDPRENLAVCSQRITQDEPVAMPDGDGGVFIVWHTFPAAGQGDLWAQHVLASGALAWAPEGVPVCLEREDQRGATITTDGAGGFVVVWRDRRNGHDWDLYAQRIGPDGRRRWAPHGLPVSLERGDQASPQAESDGRGGFVVTWADQRGGDTDLYAQSIDTTGALRWSASGVEVVGGPGEQSPAGLVTDGEGGVILLWIDTGDPNATVAPPTNLNAQRLDADGDVRWEADGLRIASDVGAASQPSCAADGAGGVIVAWEEDIVFAQRADASGTLVWGPDGVMLSDRPGDVPIAVRGEDGSAFVVWLSSNVDDGTTWVRGRWVDGSGLAKGEANGFVFAGTRRVRTGLAACADGAGGVIAAWRDGRDTEFGNLLGQRADSTGTLAWAAKGMAVSTATGFQRALRLVPDGTGGAIAIWVGTRAAVQRVYAQRVGPDGRTGGVAR